MHLVSVDGHSNHACGSLGLKIHRSIKKLRKSRVETFRLGRPLDLSNMAYTAFMPQYAITDSVLKVQKSIRLPLKVTGFPTIPYGIWLT